MDKEGAKMPPGTPLQLVIQVATNFSSTYSREMSLSPASMLRTSSAPAPKVAPPDTRPMIATIRPQAAAKRTGKRLRKALKRSGMPASDAVSNREKRPPSTPQIIVTSTPGRIAPQSSRGTSMEPK